ncbi:MAG: aldo/keto reductase family protein [candidate division Zixibacteria bacterium]|nr:aldo/keto reductase family protein [candidate division Zixibacteria bacterium]
MKYRRLGNAGLKVSEISIGGWLTFGGSVDPSMTAKILGRAIDGGINFIDLADIYSRGEAEKVCGKILKNYNRSDLVISSKLFWPMSDNINDRGLSRKHIFESIDKTLTRLNTDYLDVYFCHRYDPETEVEEVVRAMDDLIRQGKVLYWGTSVWEPPQLDDAVKWAHKYNCYGPQVEQPRYNMLDRYMELGVLPTCRRNGIGLVVWSPLAQGVLTGKYNDGIPEGTRGSSTEWLKDDLTEEKIAKVRELTEIASELGITMAQLALAWILRLKEISSAITGATTIEHVEANIAASEVELPVEIVNIIDSILGQDI